MGSGRVRGVVAHEGSTLYLYQNETCTLKNPFNVFKRSEQIYSICHIY